MSPVEAVVARVLAEHFYGAGSQGRYCSCGAMGVGIRQTNYRLHVATEIAAALRADEALVKTMAEALDHHGTIASLGLPADEFDCCARAALDAITGGAS